MLQKSFKSSVLLSLVLGILACAPVTTDTAPQAEPQAVVSTEHTREMPFVKRPFSPYLGEKWIGDAISYGCYREGQAPGVKGPSEAEILEDLNILKEKWNLIRVYGSDADSERVLKVIREHDLPFKVMLGVWIANETKHPARKAENLEQVNKAISLGNQYADLLVAINVGNESQVFWSWHRTEAETLIRYLRMVRNNVPVPVTTADDYNFWNKPESQAIAEEIDFIVLHAYALWNGQKLDHAMFWTDSVYQDIKSRYPQMDIAIGETGWATTYNPDKNGPGEQGSLIKGKVGHEAQETFFRAMQNWITTNQISVFWFEAFDEPWKGGGDQSGPNEVEKHWGLYDKDRQAKPALKNFMGEQTNE